MKKHLLVSFMLGGIIVSHAFGQTKDTTRKDLNPSDSTWKINLLQAPSSPGASLLGISPTTIQQPTDPTAFSVSLLNATNNLTTIPNSYAVDFAPAWLFGGKNITYQKFISDSVKYNIWQSFVVSFAYKNAKDSVTMLTNTSVALGFKISFLRGQVNSKALNTLAKLQTYLSNYQTLKNHEEQKVRAMTGYAQLPGNKKGALINTADSLALVTFKNNKNGLDSLKSYGEQINFNRYGWKLDLAGGVSYLFPNQINGSLNNAGAWLTGGYDPENNGFTFLAIARYLYNPKQVYDDPNDILKQNDLSTFDSGVRILYDSRDDKFTFGGELVYRSILNTSTLAPSWRYTLSTDYQIGKNQILSFVFGRDFDGTVTKTGNLIAALNFIIGFGSSKSVLSK